MSSNSWSAVCVVGFSLGLLACGGAVDEGNEAPGGAGGAVAGSGGGSGGLVTTGGSGGTTTGGSGGVLAGGTGGVATGGNAGAAGAPTCVPNAGGTGGFVEPTCEDLGALTVSEPEILENDGDGVISPGESVTVKVLLNETSGNEMMWYPGVTFTTDNALVKVNGDGWLYGIFGCQTIEITSGLSIDPATPSGTIVNVTAHVGMLSSECEGTNSITFQVHVD